MLSRCHPPLPPSLATRFLPALAAILIFASCGGDGPKASTTAGEGASGQVSLDEQDADQVTSEQPAPTCGQQYVVGKVLKFERGIVGLLDPAKFNRYIEIPVDKIIGSLQVGDWARYELATDQPYVTFSIGSCAQFAFRPADPPPPPTAAELAKCNG